MATYPRSPLPGDDWTPRDLHAYNISVHFQDASTFFGVPTLPHPPLTVDEELLTNLSSTDMQSPTNYQFMRYLELATSPLPDEPSATVDFAVSLLSLVGYLSPRTRLARRHVDVPLTICGESRYTNTDACIVDSEDVDKVLLLMREDKRHIESPDTSSTTERGGLQGQEAPLVAGAIGSFQTVNTFWVDRLRDPIHERVIPGVVFVGSSPTFYKIPVTEELAHAVSSGYFPPMPTVVHAHTPLVPASAYLRCEGMKPLDDRRKVLACFEAFKQYVE